MRAGRTKTTSFSLEPETLAALKSLAKRTHKGNVSALLAEFAEREKKFVAMEQYLAMNNDPPVTEERIARVEAEWREAVTGQRTTKRRKRAA